LSRRTVSEGVPRANPDQFFTARRFLRRRAVRNMHVLCRFACYAGIRRQTLVDRSDGSRDHSFQEPKYIRTSFTPAFFSARKVFEPAPP